ncbi:MULTISPECIES: sulfotransferase family 2 domain-containing protein [Pacificibacter]|uniref:sulfotransferase family 2 domain-containing protein n=1 Tax=Pacificibacter TaxID=1042323 RepID=UPI001C09784F|nr:MULTISPECIES: sulfotransferase family 2 domain-containing protein [Pacificibacter]MBU2937407.1 sulfotransferase family protein [Pacificibacter marinus]MDO6617049.1 sulfotransferase family 2 domain-containing protein [Pacificibacter sp. 1_MG-2023]
MTTIQPIFLRQGLDQLTVPRPHDLLREKNGFSILLPDTLYTPARMWYRRFSYMTGRKTSPFSLYASEDVAFIHIPKNAGTFINGIVYPQFAPEASTRINAHHSAQYLNLLDSHTFKKTKKFAILRNPITRLRSAFDYLKFKTPFETDKVFAETALADFDSFETFCANVSDSTFKELIKWPHFQPQISFICDMHGTLIVDALTVSERMDEGLHSIGETLGKDWSGIDIKPSSIQSDPIVGDIVDRYYSADLNLWALANNAPRASCWVE